VGYQRISLLAVLLLACATPQGQPPAGPARDPRLAALPGYDVRSPAQVVRIEPPPGKGSDPFPGGQTASPNDYARVVLCLDRRGRVTLAGTLLRASQVISPGILEQRVRGWQYEAQHGAPMTCTYNDFGPVPPSATPPGRVGGGRLRINPRDDAYRPRVSPDMMGKHINTTVGVSIDETGAVQTLNIDDPVPEGLDREIRDKLAHWRYDPLTVDGVPVHATLTVRFDFDLRDQPTPR
jgi:hypothetical protein